MSQTNPQLQRFIEDELARAPLLIDELLQQLADAPMRFPPNATTQQRQAVMDAREALLRGRQQMVRAFAQTLREQVNTTAEQQAAAVKGLQLSEADELSLSLVNEDEVAMDVELQRSIVVIHSAAEYELRELGAFTSAMVGDIHVAHDTNPFRPEAYARALLAAARALPQPVPEQLAFMHELALPFSQSLRKAYAGAAGRLEDQGITPATHRTIILPPGVAPPRFGTPTQVPAPPPADLHFLRDSMPVPLDMEPEPPAPPPSAARPAQSARTIPPQAAPAQPTGAAGQPRGVAAPPQSFVPQAQAPAQASAAPAAPTLARLELEFPGLPAARASSRVDQQLIELLTRLFDAILADRSLPQDVQLLLSRLNASAVRVALRDPAMLDSYEHPVWEFMDRLVFDASRYGGEPQARTRVMRYAEGLVDHMVREPVQDAALYGWGVGRLDAYAQHTLAEYSRESQPQIDNLRSLTVAQAGDGTRAGSSSAPQPLDVGTLDTVPAELIDLPAPSGHSAGEERALPKLKPGDWLHLFLQGQWRELLLLWTDGRGEAWLFRQPGGRTWALRRAALERLNDAGLAEPLEPPSLVQHAAQLVLRQVSQPAPR